MAELKAYISIARPDHWIKHIFIVPGVLIALVLDDSSSVDVGSIILGFVSACLISSSNYVINEYLDANFDRFHPSKKNRNAVVHDLSASWVLLEYLVLLFLGISCALFVNGFFASIATLFSFMAILYNVPPIRLKDRYFLDVLSESINNPLRLLLGWFMVTQTTVPPTSILISYWFGGAFLMAAKRFSEYRFLASSVGVVRAGQYRKSFNRYTEASLVGSMVCYALISVMLISAFIIKYRTEYFLTTPIIVALFTYYVVISFKEESLVQAPERLRSSPILIGLMMLLLASFTFLTFYNLPVLDELLRSNAIDIGEITERVSGMLK